MSVSAPCVYLVPMEPETALDPLELELLWAAMWLSGTEAGFSAKATTALNRWAIITPTPVLFSIKIK